MKKVRIKQLKALADRLPDSVVLVNKPTIVTGDKITSSEKKKLENKGEWEGPKATYTRKGYYFRPVNHLNRLKTAYKNNKEQGLIDYVLWLDRNNRKINMLYAQLEINDRLNDVDQRLIRFISQGVKNFWQNLIIFLTSFAVVFLQKEDK